MTNYPASQLVPMLNKPYFKLFLSIFGPEDYNALHRISQLQLMTEQSTDGRISIFHDNRSISSVAVPTPPDTRRMSGTHASAELTQ